MLPCDLHDMQIYFKVNQMRRDMASALCRERVNTFQHVHDNTVTQGGMRVTHCLRSNPPAASRLAADDLQQQHAPVAHACLLQRS
jgi:hypothetical protein